ncbi:hypothetical protein GCM10027030_29260 [Luteococcus sediminum]
MPSAASGVPVARTRTIERVLVCRDSRMALPTSGSHRASSGVSVSPTLGQGGHGQDEQGDQGDGEPQEQCARRSGAWAGHADW